MKTSSKIGVVLASTLSVVAIAAADDKKPDAGAAAPAAAPAAAEAPKPAPEFVEFMKDVLGNWSCTTTFAAGAWAPGSPEIKANSKLKISKGEPMLAGFFYRGEYTMAKSKEMPMSMSGLFYLGYEPANKLMLNLGIDNMGGAGMSAGPITGNTVVYTGEGYGMGKKMKMRETLTKVGPKEITHKYEADMGKGFQVMGTDVCKK